MTELIEILTNLESSSSGTGISYYSTRCPRAAQLSKEFPSPSSFNAQVGVVFHKLMELYYGGLLKDVALPIDDMADFEHDPVQEALRLFDGYSKIYSPTEWTVFAVEHKLPAESDAELHGRLLSEAVGVSPFTMRVDMVVDVNADQAKEIEKTRKLELEPGRYIVDHKTTDKKDSKAIYKYKLSHQFPAYQLGWNACFDEHPVKGVIVSQCVRHKNLGPNSFDSFFIGPPNETEVQALRAHLQRKAAYLSTNECNTDACIDWGVCAHYLSGNCQRV